MLRYRYMHYFPFYSPYAPALWGAIFSLVFILVIWTVVLKGFALWYAARAGQTWWFVALLIVNTVGILEIIYLIWFRPKDVHHRSHHAPAHTSSSAH